MAETVGRIAAWIGPGGVGDRSWQRDWLSRHSGIDTDQILVGDHRNPLTWKPWLGLLEGILDRRQAARATAEAYRDQHGNNRAPPMVAISPCQNRAHPLTLGFKRYFAVVLSFSGAPAIKASITSARSRKLEGVP